MGTYAGIDGGSLEKLAKVQAFREFESHSARHSLYKSDLSCLNRLY